jgi:hypothetical protein
MLAMTAAFKGVLASYTPLVPLARVEPSQGLAYSVKGPLVTATYCCMMFPQKSRSPSERGNMQRKLANQWLCDMEREQCDVKTVR